MAAPPWECRKKFLVLALFFLVLCSCFIIRDIITSFFIVPRFVKIDDCLTIGDIMGKYYGKMEKYFVECRIFPASIFLVLQIAASGHLLNSFMDLPYSVGVLLGMGIVVIY